MALLPQLRHPQANVEGGDAFSRLTQLPPINNIETTSVYASVGLDWSALQKMEMRPGTRALKAVEAVKKELLDKKVQKNMMSSKTWHDWVLRMVTRYEAKIEALEEELLLQCIHKGLHTTVSKETALRRQQVQHAEASVHALQQRVCNLEHGHEAVRALEQSRPQNNNEMSDSEKEREFQRLKLTVQKQACDLADAAVRIGELEEALEEAKANEVPKIDPKVVEGYENEIFELEQRVEELEGQCGNFEAELERVTEEKTKEITSLRKKMEHSRDEVQRYKDRVEELMKAAASTQETINDLEEQLRALEIEKRALQQKSAHAFAEIDSLNQRNLELQEYVTELENRRPPTPPPDVRPETCQAMLEFMNKHGKSNQAKIDTSNFSVLDEDDYFAKLEAFTAAVGNWLLALEDQVTLGKASFEKEIKLLKEKVTELNTEIKRLKQGKKCVEDEVEALRNALTIMKSASRRRATPEAGEHKEGDKPPKIRRAPSMLLPNPTDRRDPTLPDGVRNLLKRMEEEQQKSKQRWEAKKAAIKQSQRAKEEAALEHCTTAQGAVMTKLVIQKRPPNNAAPTTKRMGYFGDGLRALKKEADGPDSNGRNFVEILMMKVGATHLVAEQEMFEQGKMWLKRFAERRKRSLAGEDPASDAMFIEQIYRIFIAPDYLKPFPETTQEEFDAVFPVMEELEAVNEEAKAGGDDADGPLPTDHHQLLDHMFQCVVRQEFVTVEEAVVGITRYLVDQEHWKPPPEDDGTPLARLTARNNDFFITLLGIYEDRFAATTTIICETLNDLLRQKGNTADGLPNGFLFKGQWTAGVALCDNDAQTDPIALGDALPATAAPTMDSLRPLMDNTSRRLSACPSPRGRRSQNGRPASGATRERSVVVDETALSVSSAICALKDALGRDTAAIAEGAEPYEVFLHLAMDIITQQLAEIEKEDVMNCVNDWVNQFMGLRIPELDGSDGMYMTTSPYAMRQRYGRGSIHVDLPMATERARVSTSFSAPTPLPTKLLRTSGHPEGTLGSDPTSHGLSSLNSTMTRTMDSKELKHAKEKDDAKGERGRSFLFGSDDGAWQPAEAPGAQTESPAMPQISLSVTRTQSPEERLQSLAFVVGKIGTSIKPPWKGGGHEKKIGYLR
eukprot:TRINITY_DN13876_c0_g1_i1.p1 TRINITY_DN13876_c0_g1~~TRINITY_DN13876_c0_g1_i1.p1  ORF type:complete len:1132 (+),score=457.37 TRINITY_DN13876_c0_g1_i1:478-3873(+)